MALLGFGTAAAHHQAVRLTIFASILAFGCHKDDDEVDASASRVCACTDAACATEQLAAFVGVVKPHLAAISRDDRSVLYWRVSDCAQNAGMSYLVVLDTLQPISPIEPSDGAASLFRALGGVK